MEKTINTVVALYEQLSQGEKLRLIGFIVISVLLLILGVFGKYRYILVDENVFIRLSLLGVVLSLLANGYLVHRNFVNRRQDMKSFSKGGHPWFLIIAACFFITFVMHLALPVGLPSMLHTISNTEATRVMHVYSKYRISSPTCRYRVYVRSPYFVANDHLCVEEQEVYLAINPGDIIEVEGSESIFGFKSEYFRTSKY